MSQTVKAENAQTSEATIAPATSTKAEDSYNWSDQDLRQAVEVLNSAPKLLTPMAIRAKEAHERLFGTSH